MIIWKGGIAHCSNEWHKVFKLRHKNWIAENIAFDYRYQLLQRIYWILSTIFKECALPCLVSLKIIATDCACLWGTGYHLTLSFFTAVSQLREDISCDFGGGADGSTRLSNMLQFPEWQEEKETRNNRLKAGTAYIQELFPALRHT